MPNLESRPAAALLVATGPEEAMKSRRPRVLHPLLGKPLARYPIDLCRRLGIERIVLLAGGQADALRAGLGEEIEILESPDGSARAAASLLESLNGPVLLLPAACPLLTDEAVAGLAARHAETGAAVTLLYVPYYYATDNHLVRRAEDGRIEAIALQDEVPDVEVGDWELDAGAFLFEPGKLLAALQADAASGEEVGIQAARLLVERGEPVQSASGGLDDDLALRVRNRVDLARAGSLLRERILVAHMLAGVTVEDPTTTYVEPDVRIGQDTVLRPMTWLCGKTVVGEECEIGPSVRISDCVLGDRVTAQSAVLTESEIGEGTRIGPFAQLRPGCRIGREVKIGNFVELKNAVVEDRASMGHLAYIGDAFIGEKSNIGAGTITCNYDGKHKHQTRIGRRSFVGSHATLVAPVEVGEGAFVAAGTCVTEDVPADSLAIGRSRQAIKPEWARKRRDGEG